MTHQLWILAWRRQGPAVTEADGDAEVARLVAGGEDVEDVEAAACLPIGVDPRDVEDE